MNRLWGAFAVKYPTGREELTAISAVERPSSRETELLRRINLTLPGNLLDRLSELRQKLEDDCLAKEERAEFLCLNDEAERWNVERIEALGDLATLRGLTLRQVAMQLGIGQRLDG